MSISIIEALQNALHNFNGTMQFQRQLAKEQLQNSIDALEAEIDPFDEAAFEAFLEKKGQDNE